MKLEKLQQLIKDSVGAAVSTAIEAKMAHPEAKPKAPAFLQRKAFKADDISKKELDELTKDERSLLAGRCVRYVFAAGGNFEAALGMARNHGDKAIVDAWEKAMTTDVFASGGALVPPEFTQGIIDKLMATAVMRKLGCSIWPMNTGSLTAPFISSGATAAYVGQQGSNITKSELGTGQLQLSNKKLAALVPLSNDLLRDGGAAADRIVRDNMVRELRLVEDAAFIRYDGTQGKPRGLRYWAPAANIFDANATMNQANVAADMTKALRLLEEGNVPLDGAAWIMAPRSRWALSNLLDGNSNYIYKSDLDKGMLFGFPVGISNQIPTNLGAGTESEVYLFNAPLTVIAENENLLLEAFPGGAYYDGSAVQSGISRDETPIRAIALHDFGCQQRGTEVVVLTAVKWGA